MSGSSIIHFHRNLLLRGPRALLTEICPLVSGWLLTTAATDSILDATLVVNLLLNGLLLLCALDLMAQITRSEAQMVLKRWFLSTLL